MIPLVIVTSSDVFIPLGLGQGPDLTGQIIVVLGFQTDCLKIWLVSTVILVRLTEDYVIGSHGVDSMRRARSPPGYGLG